MLDQLSQQINGQVTVALQFLDCVLPGAQGCNFLLQAGNVLDLPFEFGDLFFKQGIFVFLTGYLGLVPGINTSAHQAAHQRSNTQRDKKEFAFLLASRLTVRQ